MKRLLVAFVLLGMLPAVALARAPDPCADKEIHEDEVGLTYQTYCVTAQLDGPAVQPLIVSVTEDLGGTHALGILLVRTESGWVVAEPEYYLADAEGVDVGDTTMGGE